jgi:hypothetical protein
VFAVQLAEWEDKRVRDSEKRRKREERREEREHIFPLWFLSILFCSLHSGREESSITSAPLLFPGQRQTSFGRALPLSFRRRHQTLRASFSLERYLDRKIWGKREREREREVR